MIVMKFGGTSTQDAAAMRNVISIVKSHLQDHPVVVISAIARGTNELERTARIAAGGGAEEAEGVVSALFARHSGILSDLLRSGKLKSELESQFRASLEELKQLVRGVSILRELTPRTLDFFSSYGERLSSRIIAAGLQEAGVDSRWIDAGEFMITDDNFGRAQPLMELVTEKLRSVVAPLVSSGKVPVTQGFIGVTQSGVPTTMGRESSDYSASIIGAAMDADLVQIWTDVDGILTADPTVVRSIRRVNRMTFEEAFELSYFGAKVLHPGTMLPVLTKKIPVQIRNSKNQKGTGTLVDAAGGSADDAGLVKSIAYRKNLTVITVTPHRRLSQYVFWEEVFSVLTRVGVTAEMMTTSEYSIAFAIDGRTDINGLTHQLEEFGTVGVFPGKGSICLVGRALRECRGVTKRIFACLAEMDVLMVSYGASDKNLTLVVDETQVPEAVNRLHAEFFERVPQGEIFDVPAL